MKSSLLILPLALAFLGCADFPKDPVGTLERVRGDTLLVGVTEKAPWIVREGDQARGIEAELIREMARDLGATVAWKWGLSDDHFAALERYQLDLAAGGLTQSTPWKKSVALTRPFHRSPLVVAIAPEATPPDDLDGLTVYVERGTALAAQLEAEDALPVTVDDPGATPGPVAGPWWNVAAWGFAPTRHVLAEERHVFALPPGENAWLVYVERFLHQRELDIEQRLSREAAP